MTCSKGWANMPTLLIDILPTCNLVANARGCTGRNHAPFYQAGEGTQTAPLIWREWSDAKQPDEEKGDSHACIVTPTCCWRSQSPSAVSLVRTGCTQRFRDSDNDMPQGVG